MALSPFDPVEPYPPAGMGEPAAPILPVAPQPPSGVPMAPQLPDIDPLTGLPAAPPAPEPQGYQFDAQGEPLKWPPDDWFAQPDAAPPAAFQGHDVPEVPNDAAPPAQVPSQASEQAGPQGMATLDQARAQGAPAPTAKPAGRPSTGDPYLDMLAETGDVKARAALQENEAAKQKNDYLSAQGVQAAQEKQAREDAANNAYAEVQKEATAKRAELDAEAKAIASTPIDTHRAWHNMSLGQQIGTAVMGYFAGTGAAKRGAKNPVLEAIDQQVAQDIAAQQADLDNRWKGNTARRGLLADGLAQGRDMLDVRYKALTTAYETAGQQAQAFAMRFDNPVLDAKTASFLADLRERQTTLGMQYEQQKKTALLGQRQQGFQNAMELRKQKFAEDNAEANRQNALELAGMRGQGKISAQEAAAQKQQESLLLDPSGDPIPDGKGGFAHLPSPDKAIEHREKLSARVAYWQKLKKYQTDLEKYGKEFGGAAGIMGRTDAMSMLEEEWADLIPSYLKMHGIQRLTHEDMMLVGGNIIAKPSSWTHSTNPLPAVNQAKKSFRDETNTEMQAVYGVHDKDWLGGYEASHPDEFKADATEAKDNQQGKAFEPVPTDATGKILTPAEMAAQKQREEAARPPSADEYVAQQKDRWESHRQANLQAVQRGARTREELPFPEVGISGAYHGGAVK